MSTTITRVPTVRSLKNKNKRFKNCFCSFLSDAIENFFLLSFLQITLAMGENKVPRANAHFLSAFLCQIELPVADDQKQSGEHFLSHPVVKAYLASHSSDSSVTNEYLEIARTNSELCLSILVNDLQLSGDVENILLGPLAQSVLKNQVPSFLILLSKDLDRKLMNQLVKIPDILSNRFHGQMPKGFEVEEVVDHILKNIFDCHCVHQAARESNIKLPVHVLAFWCRFNRMIQLVIFASQSFSFIRAYL